MGRSISNVGWTRTWLWMGISVVALVLGTWSELENDALEAAAVPIPAVKSTSPGTPHLPYTWDRFEATFQHTSTWRVKWRAVPDDCLVSLEVNGTPAAGPPLPFCDFRRGRWLPISLREGANTIAAQVYNHAGDGGLHLVPDLNPYARAYSVLLFIVAGFSLLVACAPLVPATLAPRSGRIFDATLLLAGYGAAAWSAGRALQVVPGKVSYVDVLFLVTVGVSALAWPIFRAGGSLVTFATAPYRPHHERALGLLAFLVTFYIGYASLGTSLWHAAFLTSDYDLAIQENLIWNTVHGHFFFSSVMGAIDYLGNHTSLIYLLLLPIYAALPFTETLLVLQSALLGIAAVPLYLFAARLLADRAVALSMAACYLLSTAVQGANFYDFHELCFVPVLYFSACLFLSLGRAYLAGAAILLLLLVKEDVSLLVATLGLALVAARRFRAGAFVTAAGVSAYVVFQGTLIPGISGHAGSYSFYFSDATGGATDPAAVVLAILRDPLGIFLEHFDERRALVFVQLFAPVMFLPLLGLPTLILASYGSFLYAFGTTPGLRDIGFQYALHLVPPIMIGAAVNLRTLRFRCGARTARVVAGCCVASSLVLATLFGMFAPRIGFKGGFHTVTSPLAPAAGVPSPYTSEDIEAVRRIPHDRCVRAPAGLLAHVARRPIIVPTERTSAEWGAVCENFRREP